MKNLFNFSFLLLLLASLNANAQERTSGEFTPKPKNMWEIGVHGGYFQIASDVNSLPGYGVGLHLRKSLGYTMSLRFNYTHGRAAGQNFLPNRQSAAANNQLNPTIDGVKQNFYGVDNPWYANYKTSYNEGSIQGIISLGNLLFHQKRNRWDVFAITGVGLNYYNTAYDAFDDNGLPYDFKTALRSEFSAEQLTGENRADRKEIRKYIRKKILNGKTDTDGEEWGYLFNLAGGGSDGNGVGGRANLIFNAGLGLGYLVNDRISLTLEHQYTFNDDDLIDGYRWDDDNNGVFDETVNNDYPQYTSLHVNFHLGKKSKRAIPLWWLNPLEAPLTQLDDINKKFDDLSDEDGDGVLDLVDKEPGSPADCPVDTRGVTLDSDGDNIPDCKDKEPFSPPGYTVDNQGVAKVDKPEYATKEYVDGKVVPQAAPVATSGINDWFLPMIHFDLDKYYIKPEFYPQLKHVATVMKNNPSITVVATGFTDVRMPNEYNQVLSYQRAEAAINYLVNNYGIERSRLILQYKGEDVPLIGNLPDNHVGTNFDKEKMQYMNRRVEFSIANGETQMGRPDGPAQVGEATPRSSRNGSIYSGNPGSGY